MARKNPEGGFLSWHLHKISTRDKNPWSIQDALGSHNFSTPAKQHTQFDTYFNAEYNISWNISILSYVIWGNCITKTTARGITPPTARVKIHHGDNALMKLTVGLYPFIEFPPIFGLILHKSIIHKFPTAISPYLISYCFICPFAVLAPPFFSLDLQTASFLQLRGGVKANSKAWRRNTPHKKVWGFCIATLSIGFIAFHCIGFWLVGAETYSCRYRGMNMSRCTSIWDLISPLHY